MTMFWFRVDNRLIHGQVIESWLPYTRADMIVVANDYLAVDIIRQDIMSLAIPGRIKTSFLHISELNAFMVKHASHALDALILFASCQDAVAAYNSGLEFDRLNIANLHYAPGKKQYCDHVALSEDDIRCLKFFSVKGVELDFRCVPNSPSQLKEELWQ